MKNLTTAGVALLLTTSIVQAGGLDRSGQGVGIIFEEGNLVQLSFGYISPDVSGVTTIPTSATAPAGLNSGSVGESYMQFSGGIKYAISDNVDLALIFDQPFGAKVSYADADAGFYTNPVGANVLSAEASSSAITALARYKFNENMSVHGGLRYQTVQVNVDFPLVGNYSIASDASSATGFVLGAAYEIPAIALRVALTYNSKISHDIDGVETINTIGGPVDIPGTTSVDTPESLNLDFQTGIAADTLLFGSVRYAKWTQFDFRPETFATATSGASLQDYDEDTVAYSLGVGRRFSDAFSGAVSVGYEAAQGGFAGPLAPTDGNLSVGLGGTFDQGDYKITAGVRYIMIGDADLAVPGTDTKVAEFKDNSAIAFGLQVSRSF